MDTYDRNNSAGESTDDADLAEQQLDDIAGGVLPLPPVPNQPSATGAGKPGSPTDPPQYGGDPPTSTVSDRVPPY